MESEMACMLEGEAREGAGARWDLRACDEADDEEQEKCSPRQRHLPHAAPPTLRSIQWLQSCSQKWPCQLKRLVSCPALEFSPSPCISPIPGWVRLGPWARSVEERVPCDSEARLVDLPSPGAGLADHTPCSSRVPGPPRSRRRSSLAEPLAREAPPPVPWRAPPIGFPTQPTTSRLKLYSPTPYCLRPALCSHQFRLRFASPAENATSRHSMIDEITLQP